MRQARQGRGPLFRYSGTFDPKSEQPVKFSKGKLLMPRTASSHYGNSCYSSYTVVGDERTLWHPDNKRRLYGALISARESNGAVAPR